MNKTVIALRLLYFVSLFNAGGAMVFLLFRLGHTETVSPESTLLVALVAGISALVAGMLHWLGIPADSADKPAQGGRTSRRRRS